MMQANYRNIQEFCAKEFLTKSYCKPLVYTNYIILYCAKTDPKRSPYPIIKLGTKEI